MYNREKIMQVMQDIYDESKTIAPYVMIAQPRRDLNETAAQNFDGYDGLHIDLMGFSHGFCNIGGEKVDVARNYLIERALESGAKYLLFIGEDTVLPYDGFKVLHKTAEENPGAVVTGVYYIKCSDAMIMVRNGDWITIPNVDPGQLIEAWQTGMDVMMIPIELLRQMKEEAPELPFTCIASNVEGPKGTIPFIGEDNFFVHRLHKRGTKLLVNTDVQCLHMDLATGMYTAHQSVDLKKYYTNIKPTRPLTLDDKEFIDRRWHDRLPNGTGEQRGINAIITRMIDEGQPVKFNIGSGPNKLPGYFNIDKHSKGADLNVDLYDFSPPDGCADEILASHIIEHLPQHRVPEAVAKWHLALKSGGKLVIETPNIEELFREYLNADDEKKRELMVCIYGAAVEDINNPEEQKNGALTPHLWGFTPNTLTDLLNHIGFKRVNVESVQGLHPGINFRLEAIKE